MEEGKKCWKENFPLALTFNQIGPFNKPTPILLERRTPFIKPLGIKKKWIKDGIKS